WHWLWALWCAPNCGRQASAAARRATPAIAQRSPAMFPLTWSDHSRKTHQRQRDETSGDEMDRDAAKCSGRLTGEQTFAQRGESDIDQSDRQGREQAACHDRAESGWCWRQCEQRRAHHGTHQCNRQQRRRYDRGLVLSREKMSIQRDCDLGADGDAEYGAECVQITQLQG